MIMVNKWVLNAIPVPAFFLFCQLAIAVLLLRGASAFGFFVLPRVDMAIAMEIWPLVTINVIGLLFNTYCLQFVDASFYQVARGLVLPFTVFFSYMLLGSKSSMPTLIAVFIVCFGFFLGVSAEHLTVHALGVAMGVASSLTTSVHAIVVKRSLSVVPSSLDLAYYSNLFSALAVLPVVAIAGEVPVILEMINGSEKVIGDSISSATASAAVAAATATAKNSGQLHTFITGVIVTGFFGFLICVAGFLSIKVTSPVTHMISSGVSLFSYVPNHITNKRVFFSACRGVLQTFLGSWLFGDIITT